MNPPGARNRVRLAASHDRDAWLDLRRLLWPEEAAQNAHETADYFVSGRIADIPHAVFVADDTEPPIALSGFLECSLRDDRIRGGRPLRAHVEGWFVLRSHRRRGVGRALLNAAAEWARAQGCAQLTSDTVARYAAESIPAHVACGFRVVTSSTDAEAADHLASGGFWLERTL